MNELSWIQLGSQLVFCALLILLYAFFILVSISITRSKAVRVRELSRRGFLWGKYARFILARSNVYLLASQIGAFLSALFTGFYLDELIRPILNTWVLTLPGVSLQVSQLIFVVAVVLLAGLFALVLVQLSKLLAFSRPERVLCLVSVPIIFIARVFTPFIWMLQNLVTPLVRRFGLGINAERELAPSAEELNDLLDLSRRAGQIDQEERDMIQGVFEFSKTLAREVMTPRKDIIYVEESATLQEILAVFAAEKLSRLVVVGRDLDQIRGVLMAKDLLPFVNSDPAAFDIKKILRRPHFVPHNKRIDELLNELRSQRVHFAIVLDEHGGVDGVLTIEDLVEEIVGEIMDEYDSPAEEREVEVAENGDLLVGGGTSVDLLNSTYGCRIPEGEYDSVGGYILHRLGHIPIKGESVETNGIKLRVEEVEGNRVNAIRIIDLNRSPKKNYTSQGVEITSNKEQKVLPKNLKSGILG